MNGDGTRSSLFSTRLDRNSLISTLVSSRTQELIVRLTVRVDVLQSLFLRAQDAIQLFAKFRELLSILLVRNKRTELVDAVGVGFIHSKRQYYNHRHLRYVRCRTLMKILADPVAEALRRTSALDQLLCW